MWWTKRNSSLLVVLLLTITLCGQERIRFMTYNVENLFDCTNDTLTDDDAFTPEAIRRWTPYRYWNKLQAVARTIASVGEDRAPDFIALCEVENDSVMYDFTRRSSLRTAGYKYIMTSSEDSRGIDVALMYKPTTFRPYNHQSIHLPQTEVPEGRTVRDVLLASGQLYTGDTLDIFICHLPSRLRGKQSEQLRHSVAEYMCQAIDSVRRLRTTPYIIVMGDCNDTAHSWALRPLTEQQGLACITDNLKGSYRYKGKWEQIDHIFVSQNLLHPVDSTTLHLAPYGAWNFTAEFLTESEPKYGGKRPRRTYNGMRYEGGTSDHFPVCFDLWFRW